MWIYGERELERGDDQPGQTDEANSGGGRQPKMAGREAWDVTCLSSSLPPHPVCVIFSPLGQPRVWLA